MPRANMKVVDQADRSAKASSGGEPGERPRLPQLYDEYFPFVWRSLQHLGVWPEHLDDAAQDVFVVVFQRLNDFEGRSSLKTWIFGIVHLIALTYFRREKRTRRQEPLPEDLLHAPHDPLGAAQHAEDAAFFQAFLERLDLRQRAVFVMADLEEMTAPEIADAMGIKLNTVYSRLRLARTAFRRALARHERGLP